MTPGKILNYIKKYNLQWNIVDAIRDDSCCLKTGFQNFDIYFYSILMGYHYGRPLIHYWMEVRCEEKLLYEFDCDYLRDEFEILYNDTDLLEIDWIKNARKKFEEVITKFGDKEWDYTSSKADLEGGWSNEKK